MKIKPFHLLCSRLLKEILNKKTTLDEACKSTKNPKLYFKILYNALQKYKKLAKNTILERNDKYLSVIMNSLKFKNDKVKNENKFIRINTHKMCKLEDIKLEKTQIDNVYLLNQKFDSECPLFKSGYYFVQNISSCIPAFVLNPPINSIVIDTCAAPGNKTTHLSAIMKNTGLIYAVEKNLKRYGILNETIKRSESLNIKTINCDFTDLEFENFTDVEYALVDPSCSGSGIHKNYKRDEERLKLLQSFQIKILNHVVKFKNIKKIVYSTCSVEKEENEEVVKLFLTKNKNFKLSKIMIEGFKNGDSSYEFSDSVLRIKNGNGIDGFFVALFEKVAQ